MDAMQVEWSVPWILKVFLFVLCVGIMGKIRSSSMTDLKEKLDRTTDIIKDTPTARLHGYVCCGKSHLYRTKAESTKNQKRHNKTKKHMKMLVDNDLDYYVLTPSVNKSWWTRIREAWFVYHD